MGDIERPGIKSLVESLQSQGDKSVEKVVDGCLDLMGPLEVQPDSRVELIEFVEERGEFSWDTPQQIEDSKARISELLQLIVSLREYQYA